MTMGIRVLCSVVAGVVAVGTMDAGAARADAVADFYKGKTVSLIVSTGAGGSYDTIARQLSRFMPKHIPGEPSIVVKQMPGAGHMLATNFMFEQAPKDGSHIATVGNTIPLHQVLDGKGARYQANKFNWLGTTGISNLMTVAWGASGVKTIEDAMKREVTAGSTGAGSGTSLYPTVMNKVLGTKFKIIAGYQRAVEIDLAMERGEVDVRSGFSYGSLAIEHPDWLREKKAAVLVQVGGVREPDFPDVPLMSELAKTDEQRQILTLISSTVALGRPYLTTPGVPADRLAALRKAFMDTLADKAFLAEAQKLNFDLRPADAAAVTKIVEDVVNSPPDIVAKTKDLVGELGGG
jgi:tripartite-type tricarboxylate transporter receptor subunit TctC